VDLASRSSGSSLPEPQGTPFGRPGRSFAGSFWFVHPPRVSRLPGPLRAKKSRLLWTLASHPMPRSFQKVFYPWSSSERRKFSEEAPSVSFSHCPEHVPLEPLYHAALARLPPSSRSPPHSLLSFLVDLRCEFPEVHTLDFPAPASLLRFRQAAY